ncbi:MAG: hypothetical protein DRK00_08085 [Thermoprotei archaeon]|nr:MAG: hypothetical protein DRK00_08085 [Thermoprotei archaeon]
MRGEEVLRRVRGVLDSTGLPRALSVLGIGDSVVDLVVEHAWTYERNSIEVDLSVPDKYSLRELLSAAVSGGRGGLAGP